MLSFVQFLFVFSSSVNDLHPFRKRQVGRWLQVVQEDPVKEMKANQSVSPVKLSLQLQEEMEEGEKRQWETIGTIDFLLSLAHGKRKNNELEKLSSSVTVHFIANYCFFGFWSCYVNLVSLTNQ